MAPKRPMATIFAGLCVARDNLGVARDKFALITAGDDPADIRLRPMARPDHDHRAELLFFWTGGARISPQPAQRSYRTNLTMGPI